jgi:hypothetical protein
MIETEWFGWRVSILLCDEPQANRHAMPDKVDSVAAQIVFTPESFKGLVY